MRRASVLWVLLAASGVMLVAGVTLAASSLSTQTIGLSSEPLSAGDELAPEETATPAAERRARRRDRVRGPSRTATPTASTRGPAVNPTATARPPVATVDDDDDNSGSGSSGSGSGGGDDSSGRGRGRGRGGDDDD